MKSLKPITQPALQHLYKSDVPFDRCLQHVLINKIQTIDEIQSTETLIVLQNPIMRTIKP